MPFLSGPAQHIVGSASSTRAHRKFGFCCYTGTKWLLWVFFIEGTGTFIPLLASDFLPVVMQLDWQVGFDVYRHCHVLPSSVSWSCFVELCILSELLAVVSQPVVCWSCSAEVCLFLLESYSFAFHECMLFLAISSFNTYLVIILWKFARCCDCIYTQMHYSLNELSSCLRLWDVGLSYEWKLSADR